MLVRIVFVFGALMVVAVVGMLFLAKLPSPSTMPEVATVAQTPVPTVEITQAPAATTRQAEMSSTAQPEPANPVAGLAAFAQGAMSAATQQAAAEVQKDRRLNTADRAQALVASRAIAGTAAGPAVPANYYATWSDLIARCWDSVSNNTEFDDLLHAALERGDNRG